jgi:hypothetical protein
MAIEKIGQWWYGSEACDIEPYLQALTMPPRRVDEVRASLCVCGSSLFHLDYQNDAAGARRICVLCRNTQFIGDAKEFWEEEKSARLACTICNSQEFNLAVGFCLDEARHGVQWLYVGERCAWCHVLGSCPDWEIGYTPSLHLLEKV